MFYRRINEDILVRLLKYLLAAALIIRAVVFHSSSQQFAQNALYQKNILNLQVEQRKDFTGKFKHVIKDSEMATVFTSIPTIQ